MAARDTEALKMEKEKLEEHVEELTSHLDLERKLRIDLEKNKAGEISQLQSTLREMEQRVEEATEMKERELAKKAVEEALAQERGKITLLSNEVEELKILLLREQEENNATKSALLVAQERNDALDKKIEFADENMEELRVTVKRFKASVTELESSLMIERQQNKALRKELGEAQQRVEELTRQVADANEKSTKLQTALRRLQESLIERDASLLTERQENEATKKSITEAHGRIEELLNKIEVTENDIVNFQDNILRLEETTSGLETSLLAEKHQSIVAMSQLAETQQAVEVLQKKFAAANRTNDLLQDSLKRLEETATTRDALYVAERQEHDQTKQTLSRAQERNWELLRKLDDAEKSINKLLENVQRLEKHATSRESLLLKTKQNLDCTAKALAEAQGRNRDLVTNFEDSAKKITMLEDSLKRFEADATSRGTILLSEKQAHETTKKILTEAQQRYEESIHKIQDSDESILQLRLTAERLQEKASATEALLLREREQNNAIMKAHAESQERNLQLLKKFEDVDKKICLLQGTVQRLGDNTAKDNLLFSERCEKDELKKALIDSEHVKEELLMKTEEANKNVEHLQNTIILLKENILMNTSALEAERQENETIRRSLVEAKERNDVLCKKVRDSEYRAHQLQDTVQKLQIDAISRLSSFVMDKQEGDSVQKTNTDSRGRNDNLIRRNDELVKKIEDSDKIVTKLHGNLERLEGKAANLEAENQMLRQQAIPTPPSTAKAQAAYSKINSFQQRSQENGHILNGSVSYAEMKSICPTEARPSMVSSPDLMNQKDYENGDAMQRLRNEVYQHQQPQNDQQLLLKYITQYLGFFGSKPIAAPLIYYCLLHWRSFEETKTGIFDSIIQAINSATEAQHDTRSLAYWLSNMSTLSVLLQRSFKITRATISAPLRRRYSCERIFQAKHTSNSGLAYFSTQSVDGAIGLHQIEARYPALLFKQQLVDLIEKVYGMISDKWKKELNPLLELCIQDPRTSFLNQSKASATGSGPQDQLMHWLSIVKILNHYLHLLRANHVPSILVHKLLTQIFSMVNVQLFNRLLLRRECCSFSNGQYIRAGLTQLKHWCADVTREFADSAWVALRHIKQAVDFLVISLKPIRTWEEIRTDVCPALTLQQLERDDVNGTNITSAEFISSMKATLREESNSVSGFSVLLDDDSSIPFSLEDIARSMPNIEDTSDYDLLPFICENQSFAFLLH